jgi:hypothetical protein
MVSYNFPIKTKLLIKVLFSLIVGFGFVAIVLVFFEPLYDTSDDLGYKCAIEGNLFYKKPTIYLVFVKGALAEIKNIIIQPVNYGIND